ncbi:uncharacterized protein METZ01_LOCUS69347 [marine metagenome]|uniref:Uncharacterized protein n=1 Tax=marine metagenome TaxID=408172 RepID=A0A381TR02_9ZZZZ
MCLAAHSRAYHDRYDSQQCIDIE